MEDLLLQNAEIWTLDGPIVISNGWLTTRAGYITALGEGSPPESIQARCAIDCQGQILMPGLVDCHTHLMEYATSEINHTQGKAQRMSAVSNLLLALQSGIVATGEHNLGHPTLSMVMAEYKEILSQVPMASAISYGCCWLGFEPKVLTSATRPAAAFDSNVLTEEDYWAMAEFSEFAGESLFLNYTCANAPLASAPNAGGITYDRETLTHIIDVFHGAGKPIGAHIEGDEAARLFIECGGDVIHHGHGLSPALGELMAKQGTFLVITPLAGTSRRPTHPEEALAFYRQGVRMALASDSYIYPHPQADWISLPQNRLAGPAEYLQIVGSTLRYFIAHGVERWEVLRLITVNPRQLLHSNQPPAVLAPGRPADMIVCRSLPGLETENPDDILLVITQGQVQVDKRSANH